MQALEMLSVHLKNRLVDLKNAKNENRKIVGYTPGGYFPEELAVASGAIPICFIRGGDHSILDIAGGYICRWIDTFCRAQIGYGISGDDPYYNMVDLLVVPITDNHIRAISDILDYNTQLEIFPFGVPHMKEPSTFAYYKHGISRLRSKIEELIRTRISDSMLREAIALCNRERKLLRDISEMRKSEKVMISGKDFAEICHGCLVANKKFMISVLELLYEELKEEPPLSATAPRILLTGSTLAMGDYRILDLIEAAGGTVVIEEFAEGIPPYWEDVETNGDLMQCLAECFFMKRVPPAWFRPGRERLDFLIKLVNDFKVDGVIWYQLMYRESYKTESYYFSDRLKKEAGLPMLTIESDYDPSETGQLATRIDAFIETIRR